MKVLNAPTNYVIYAGGLAIGTVFYFWRPSDGFGRVRDSDRSKGSGPKTWLKSHTGPANITFSHVRARLTQEMIGKVNWIHCWVSINATRTEKINGPASDAEADGTSRQHKEPPAVRGQRSQEELK